MHEVDERDHILDRRLLMDAMPQIEDVTGTRGDLVENALRLAFDLVPAGDNRLESRTPIEAGAGAKVVTVVTLPGKPAATARFTLK